MPSKIKRPIVKEEREAGQTKGYVMTIQNEANERSTTPSFFGGVSVFFGRVFTLNFLREKEPSLNAIACGRQRNGVAAQEIDASDGQEIQPFGLNGIVNVSVVFVTEENKRPAS